MIPPSWRAGNIRSWSDPVVVPSDQSAPRRARAMHEFFFEKLRNPARVHRVEAMRQFFTIQLNSM
jgi:hypothetical protein